MGRHAGAPEMRLRQAAKQIELAAETLDSLHDRDEEELAGMVTRLRSMADEVDGVAAR